MRTTYQDFIDELVLPANFQTLDLYKFSIIDGMLAKVSEKLQVRTDIVEGLATNHNFWMIMSDNVNIPDTEDLIGIIGAMKRYKVNRESAKPANGGS